MNNIENIRQKINDINLPGWLCDTLDDGNICVFNDKYDACIIADIDGNILSTENVEPFSELLRLVDLECEIRRAAEEETEREDYYG